MSTDPLVPDADTVRRYRNLCLHLWAPPEAAALAATAFRDVLGELFAEASHAYLLGYRPGRVLPELAEAPDEGLARVLGATMPGGPGGSFHEVPRSMFVDGIDVIAAGSVNLCRRRRNDAGIEEIVHTHVATPLVVAPMSTVGRVLCRREASSPVRRSIAIVTNPLAGIHQHDAKELRRAVDGLEDAAVVLWLASSRAVRVLAPAATLEALRRRLSESLGDVG